jgi:hypothetical protein
MRRSAVTGRTAARVVGLLAFTALALGVPATAASALSATTSLSAQQGGTVTISGNVTPSGTCAPGATVQITSTPVTGTVNLFPGGLGPQVATDASGNFHASVVIPVTTPVGAYSIGVRCGTTAVATNEILNVTAATHPPSITVSPTSAPAGHAVTIAGVVPTTGAAFCPAADAAQLTSTLFPSGLGPQVTRNATGGFSTSYTIPAATSPGTFSIGIRCGGANVGVTATLKVTTATATTTTVPATTTTAAPTTTVAPVTVAPATSVPAPTTTLLPPATTKTKSNSRTLRWVGLGVLVVVVIVGGAVVVTRR